MEEDTVLELKKSEKIVVEDTLVQILKESAQKLLGVAFEAEIETFLQTYSYMRDADGKRESTRG